MANVEFPYMSPLRFYNASNASQIDYVDIFPTVDLMRPRQFYQKGIYATPNLFPSWSTNEQMNLQVYASSKPTAVIRNTETGLTDVVSSILVASSVRNGLNAYLLIVQQSKLSVVGIYQIELRFTGIPGVELVISDEFKTRTWADTQDMVTVEFYDTENSNGGYFFDASGNAQWPSPKVFYTGILSPGEIEYDSSEFTDQPNNTYNLRSTPKIIQLLTITDVHKSYVSNIQYQFSCDNLLVSGVKCARENIEVNYIDKSDTVESILITLSRNNNTNVQEIS